MLLSSCQDPGSPPVPGAVTETTTAPPAASASPSGSSSPSSGNPGVYKPADSKGKAENVPVPVMPELAKENSKEGLEAFIRYWYEVKSYANQTGDVSTLADLSSADCRLCNRMKKASVDSYRNGRWLAGGSFSIPAMEIEWEPGSASHRAKVQVVQDGIAYFNSDGSEGRVKDVATNDVFIVTAEYRTRWQVVDAGAIAKDR
ncbi:DUF6318 family protein [Paenarthrobacter sp. PAE-2]|uniref:DUF6318 family protein n=1 Tax=Paenarthrobacter sp. PAE-2 TaxID=2982532 RepID=UPI00222EA40D|nr:DUF6318 family protein [Paenarthrobacter sp. PAE-2]MCW3768853.1 DUF6318 family protein [Paenarthrobacter sp. PAE-2]